MTPERWRQIDSVLHAALERDADQRGDFLAAACAGDPLLRREVEAQLAAQGQAEGFLEAPAIDHLAAAGGLAAQPSDPEPRDGAPPAPGSGLGPRLGPYRILHPLGHGGMGTVYLAARDDGAFEQQVAIKVGERAASDPDLKRRFRSERQILAQLDHPNIAKLLDGGTTPAGHPYFVMEYVAGTRIDEYCDHQQLSTERRIELFRKVCAAVHYAHRNQVVHRDVKPHNVLVTAAGEPKLLDFGIAKLLDPEAFPCTVATTRPGEHPMTPQYASPEQICGAAITPVSDVYSLGVLLYQLLTGRLPYRPAAGGRREMERALAEQEPVSPSATVVRAEETVDENGRRVCSDPAEVSRRRGTEPHELRRRLAGDLDHIVLKALRSEPERRYGSVEELSGDLGRHLEGLRVVAWRDRLGYRLGRIWRRRRGRLAVALPVLLVAVFAAGFLLSRLRPPPPPAAAEDALPSLAVLGFKNLSGHPESDWMSVAIAEVFAADLASGQQLRIIPGESVARMRLELALPEADALASDTLARIRRNLGADFVMLGSYLVLDQGAERQISLQVRVQETRRGAEVASASESGSQDQLVDLVSRVGSGLRTALGIRQGAAADVQAARATVSSRPEATRLYAEGLEKLRRYDVQGARDRLQRAVQIDPDYALAHAALSEVWMTLHYDAKAEASARRALELAAELPPEAVLMIEARRYEAAADWQKAIGRYEVLWSHHPNNVDHGLRLAAVQTKAGEGRAALTTIAALRGLPPPAGEDPRLDLAEAAAARSRSDFQRMRDAAARAAAKGEAQSAWTLVAQARRMQGFALLILGERQAAAEALADALRLFERTQDRDNEAQTLNTIAALAYFDGRLSDACEYYRQALAIMRGVGNRERVSVILSNLAEAVLRQGDLSAAMEMAEEAMAIAREVGFRPAKGAVLNNTAWIHLAQGQLAAAKVAAQGSLDAAEQTGTRRVVAWSYYALGQIALVAGDPDDARGLHDQAWEICHPMGFRHLEAFVLHGLGQVLLAAGDLAGARQRVGESIALRSEMGEQGNLAISRTTLAAVLLAQGQPQRAEKEAELAARELAREGRRDDAAFADTVLAAARLAQGRPAAAREIFARAAARAAVSENPQLAVSSAIMAARLHAAGGDHADALEEIEAAVTRAREVGLGALELEARLAWGQIELAAGKATAGQARLAALATEAAAKGFGLIARQATLDRPSIHPDEEGGPKR